MNHDELAGDWKQLAAQIKEQWGKLTHDELKQVDGSRLKLIGLLQEKYGYAKRRAEEELEDFLNDSKENVESIKEKAVHAFQNFSEDMSENIDEFEEKFKECSSQLEEYIQEYPIKSIVVAAGIGVLLGLLLKSTKG
jgi:uncharacterized protein YjbJ (UPF0337 family)